MNWRNSAAAAVVVLTAAACHPPRPAAPAVPPRTLQTDIDSILDQPALSRGYWGVLVKSLASGDTIYSRDAAKLLMPASNMKIVTVAAAAARLGWDYTYDTSLFRAGAVDGGALLGDLVVVGTGDPSLSLADGSAERAFGVWARQLQGAGIRTVRGRVIGDDRRFTDDGLGFGWSWDDLPDDYAAAVGALQFNEDAARVVIVPGPSIGADAAIAIAPSTTGLTIDNNVVTTDAAGAPAIDARRLPGSSRLAVRGSIPAGWSPITRVVSVDNPTQFFVNALRQSLAAHGIDVQGPAVDVDDVRDVPARERMTLVSTIRSAPLSALAQRLMKVSQNQYAETFLKTIGAAAGIPTAIGGRTAVTALLQEWGVAANDLIVRDGSGLSRYNYVTPQALVAVLTHVAHDERLRAAFEATLPIAGEDGTLGARLKGTAAASKVLAKTGSMSNVRALSGYLTTTDGERLVFSIIANNFDAAPAAIVAAIDSVVERIVQFRR